MVAFFLASACIGLILAGRSFSLPLGHTTVEQVTLSYPLATPVPRFVAYSDSYDGSGSPPSPSLLKGFNTFILSFLMTEGAQDNAQSWAELSPDQRSSIKSQYASAGIKLMVSAFGSTDTPTTSGSDPVDTANKFASWVKQYQLDGIDVDYEDLDAMNKGDGKAENWLVSFTKQLRSQLPADRYIITHAPLAPWFQPNGWGGGGYLKVHSSVGNLIDWYNVQFYNQGDGEYANCTTILFWSTSTWPNTSVFQIAGNGVDLSKIVIGKPATPSDASNGHIDTNTLASCLSQGKSNKWNGGAMVWQYPNADSHWIAAVRAQSWPVS